MSFRPAPLAVLFLLLAPSPSRPQVAESPPRTRVWCAAPVAPGQHVAFRQTVLLAEAPVAATVSVAAVGTVEIAANGVQVFRATAARSAQAVPIGAQLRRGRNVVAIRCDDRASAAGLWFQITIRYPSGRTVVVTSDGDERVAIDPSPGWSAVETQDHTWPRAALFSPHVAPPVVPKAPRVAPGPVRPGASTAAAATGGDASRLVRVWSLSAGGKPGDSLYGRERRRGDRMILCTSVPSPEDAALAVRAGFTLWASERAATGEEEEPGVFDFRQAAEARRAASRAGADWLYTASVATPPSWYARQVPYARRTFADGTPASAAFSPWEPRFAPYAGRLLGQAVERLGGVDGLGGVVVGLADYQGEATSAGSSGWLCGDVLARAAFGEAMLRRYGDVEMLNAAWGTSFGSAADVRLPKVPTAGRRRYWLDFAQWYRSSISAMADAVCRVARQAADSRLVALDTDLGDLVSASGTDHSQLAKSASRHGATLVAAAPSESYPRSIGEGLGLAAAACRYYGAPLWLSAAADRPANERIFTAASLGASGLRESIDGIRSGREGYYRYGRHLRVDAPVVDVAMLYPTSSVLLRGAAARPELLIQACADLRDVMDFDVIDERMVLDGALSRYRVLVLCEGPVYERETLDRVREWVRQGGVVAAYDFGKIETVEGDLTWFRDVFAHAGRLRRAEPNWRFVPAPGQRVRARYRVAVNLAESAGFLIGDWPVTDGARRAGAGAGVAWPVLPGRDYLVTVTLGAAGGGSAWTAYVNGVNVGTATPERPVSLRVPAAALTGATVAVCSLQPAHAARTPESALAPVESVEVVAVGAGESDIASVSLGGRFEVGIDRKRLRSEWTRPYGAGLAVYYPATRQSLAGYYEVVRTLAYRLSELEAGRRDALALDDAWDGVYASLQGGRVLLYNASPREVSRSVRVPFESGARTVAVSIEAGGIVSLPLGPPTVEMLFQCEKFTSLGGTRPESGATYSPGRGVTHVLIPSRAFVETRFQCDTPGVYTVYYRAVRRGARAAAEVLVDGTPLARPLVEASRLEASVTLSAGQVRLTRGIHTLRLRPRRGEDLRADFVVLTNDPTIGGYAFAVP